MLFTIKQLNIRRLQINNAVKKASIKLRPYLLEILFKGLRSRLITLKRPPIYLFSFFIPLFLGCQDTIDYYIGVPLQPEFEENNYQEGLNILGVLRPDSVQGFNPSFVHVQSVTPAINTDEDILLDSVAIEETTVIFSWEENNLQNEITFEYTSHDSLFKDKQFRAPKDFLPKIGITYNLQCNSKDLPALTAQTRIPNRPKLKNPEIITENQQVSFHILTDTTAFLYDIYLLSDSITIHQQRIKPNDDEDTFVSINHTITKNEVLQIYAYDRNLADYYLNSNTSLNFNKYRLAYTTVENGYGVLGSVNMLKTELIP